MKRFVLILFLIAFSLKAEKPGINIHPDIKTFLTTYCYECHDEEQQKGDKRLDLLNLRVDNSSTAQLWQDILDILNTGDMPPKKATQPKTQELSKVIGLLTDDLLKARKILTDQGGEIVVRRLNKREYINTIESLTEIKLPPRLVPDDEVSEGFDTMGANQYFSPALIDSYMELAELALEKLLIEGNKPQLPKRNIVRRNLFKHVNGHLKRSIDKRTAQYKKALLVMDKGEDYKKHGFSDKQEAKHAKQNYKGITTLQKHYLDHKKSISNGFLLMHRAHEKENVATNVDFRGRYIFRIKIATEKGMPAERKYLEVNQNDKLLGYYHIHGTMDKPQILEIEVEPEIDVKRISISIKEKDNNRLPRTYYQGRYTKKVLAGETLPSIWAKDISIEGPFYDNRFRKKRDEILSGIDPNKATDLEIKKILGSFAHKAFRGSTVSSDYLNHLLGIYKQELSFKKSKIEALIKPLATILTSPQFLFLGEKKPAGVKRTNLASHELAARLSYTLWKDMPSAQLLQKSPLLVKDNKQLKNQINQMINNPQFDAFIEDFFGQWLHLQKFDSVAFSTRLYPQFDGGLILSAKQEIFAFIQVLIKENLSLDHFIQSDFTVVNSMLATYYGLPGAKSGDQYVKVKLPPAMSYRGGLLGKAAVQGMLSTGERTAPVERGAFVLRKFLNQPPPPPPPNVPQLDNNNRRLTVKQKLDRHKDIAQCRSCHSKMDPLGLAMENFDSIGRWRTLRPKQVQELAGQMPNGKPFKDFDGLKAQLMHHKDGLVESIIEGLIKYALGREPEFSDQDFIEQMVRVCKQNNYRFRPLLIAFLSSNKFTQK